MSCCVGSSAGCSNACEQKQACMQVFLAMPSACPVAPDGSKRSVPTGADDRGAVTMYTSDDNAETFKQVSMNLAIANIAPVLTRSSSVWRLCFLAATVLASSRL